MNASLDGARPRRRGGPLALAVLLTLASMPLHAGPTTPAAPGPLPDIVFVSRRPCADPTGVPGLGPHHRADAPGGRLMLRARDGAVRELLPAGAFHDVSDPSVSPDARTLAFAGVERSGAPWRIYICGLDGRGVRRVTGSDSPRDDDLDPCWTSDRTLCFARASADERAQYADVPVTNLFGVSREGGPVWRITADRNGAEEPAFDPVRGRIVYARWWFNRFLPVRSGTGLTTDRTHAETRDTVNLWHAVEIRPDGTGLRLAAGSVRPRHGTMAYQPCVLPDGDLVAVVALNSGLSPASGPLTLQRLRRGLGASRRVVGAALEDAGDASYGDPRGLEAPSAVSPAALPDGRIVFSYDPGARGDYGLYVMRGDGTDLAPVVDLPGTLELDPAPVIPWPSRASAARAATLPPAAPADTGFTFSCRNLFATGPTDSPVDPAPPLAWPLRIRFFASRPGAGGDTAVLVREANVRPDGSILERGLPSWRPLFEQIVDAGGLPLATAHGAAHVAGSNYAPPGAVVRCVGCHAGHSTLPADGSDASLRLFDAAPSATVSASSRLPGTVGPEGAVDRRTRGDPARVAWIAASDSAEWLSLAWEIPLRVREVDLRPLNPGATGQIEQCEVTVWHKDRITARAVAGPLGREGRRVATRGALCDRIEIRSFRVRGASGGVRRVALAEVEVVAEFAPEGLNEPAGPRQAGTGSP